MHKKSSITLQLSFPNHLTWTNMQHKTFPDYIVFTITTIRWCR